MYHLTKNYPDMYLTVISCPFILYWHNFKSFTFLCLLPFLGVREDSISNTYISVSEPSPILFTGAVILGLTPKKKQLVDTCIKGDFFQITL